MPEINFDLQTIILIINVVTFVLFGFDKFRAKTKGFRVPEIVLILLSLFFGGVGALLGMVLFNHKTSKMVFRIIVPLSFVLNYVLCYDSFSIFKSLLNRILALVG